MRAEGRERRGMPRWILVTSRSTTCWSCAAALTLAALCMLACCSPVDSEASGSSGNGAEGDSASAETSATTTSDSSQDTRTTDDAEPAQDPDAAQATVEDLTRHAQRLWSARVAEDWKTVFEYQQIESENVTADDFAQWSTANEPFVVRSYTIEDVVVDDDMGWIEAEYESTMRQFPNSPPRVSKRVEKWQIVDGRWKLIPPEKLDLYPESPKVRDREQEERLTDRFRQSWEARAAEDWDALYAMADPRDRGDVSLDAFAEAKELTKFIDYEIDWVEVIDNVGTVRVAITHKLNDPNMQKLPPTTLVMSEKWVQVDGQWYMDLDGSGGTE